MGVDEPYRYIATLTITESGVMSVGLDKDENGNPFALKDIFVNAYLPKLNSIFTIAYAINTPITNTSSGYNVFKINNNMLPLQIYDILLNANIVKRKYWSAEVKFNSDSLTAKGIIELSKGYTAINKRGASYVRKYEWDTVSSLSFCISVETGFAIGTEFEIWGR